jgi:hypothetical protein
MALDDDRKFKIYIKAEGQGNWYEVGNNGKTILSNNYGPPAANATDDVGMKINTTTTFTANDGDEMCIISHNNSGIGAVDGTVSSHRILKLKYAQSQNEANYKLKLCKSDVIKLDGGWSFYQLSGGVPIGTGVVVTSMSAGASATLIDTLLTILIGKNNKGWNVSILDENFGMGDQGVVRFPELGSSGEQAKTGTDNGDSVKDIGQSQQINLRSGGKNGFTMLGWYKSWPYTFPKLVDPFNIVKKVYYYNGPTGEYLDIDKNEGTAGIWNGPSSSGAPTAQTWNITTYGLSTGIWVECETEIGDFEEVGGMGNANGNHKAPFVFLAYD